MSNTDTDNCLEIWQMASPGSHKVLQGTHGVGPKEGKLVLAAGGMAGAHVVSDQPPRKKDRWENLETVIPQWETLFLGLHRTLKRRMRDLWVEPLAYGFPLLFDRPHELKLADESKGITF